SLSLFTFYFSLFTLSGFDAVARAVPEDRLFVLRRPVDHVGDGGSAMAGVNVFDRLLAIADRFLEVLEMQDHGVAAEAAPMFFAFDDFGVPALRHFGGDHFRIVVISFLQFTRP